MTRAWLHAFVSCTLGPLAASPSWSFVADRDYRAVRCRLQTYTLGAQGGGLAISRWRLRILQLHTRYRQVGGEDTVVRAEARLLREAGNSVRTLEVRNPESVAAATAGLAAAVWNPMAQQTVRRVVQAYRPDVAHVHNTWFALSPSVLSTLRNAGVPTVATLHNYRLLCSNGLLYRDGHPCQDCVGSHPWHGVRHRCYRGSAAASAAAASVIALHRTGGTWAQNVGLFLALTEFARQRFIAGGLPPERIMVKPNFAPDPGPRRAPPAESDLVLYVGRLSPEKGIAQLVDAWRRAAPAGLRLAVVGEGPLREPLAALAAPGVELIGARPAEEVRRLMLGARALVFPSQWYEPFGLVVVEAMAAGLPVLASDIGGVRELTGEDGAAQLLPPADIDRWVAALRGLEQSGWLTAAGAAARRRYECKFSPGGNLKVLLAAYDLARAGRGAEA